MRPALWARTRCSAAAGCTVQTTRPPCGRPPPSSPPWSRWARRKRARALGEDTLQRSRRVLGPDHARTLWAATALVTARAEVGEVEQARALAQDTLQRSRRVLGPEHPLAPHLTQVTGSGPPMPGGDAADERP